MLRLSTLSHPKISAKPITSKAARFMMPMTKIGIATARAPAAP